MPPSLTRAFRSSRVSLILLIAARWTCAGGALRCR